jgi:signal transduction histidine kinase
MFNRTHILNWINNSLKIFEGSLSAPEIAFSMMVLVGFSALFSTQAGLLTPSFITILSLLGLFYTVLGIYGLRLMVIQQSVPFTILYFVIILILGGLINWMGLGSNFLILLPLVSVAITNTPRHWGYSLCLLIWLVIMFPIFQATAQMDALVSAASQTLAAVVFVAVFTQISVNERRAHQELGLVNQKLREYAAKAEELATVQERNRLAREIHDGLGHYLTAVNIQIKAAQSVLKSDPDLALTTLNNAQTLTQEALADVRRSISSLRNDPTSNRPLPEILTQLLNEVKAAGIETTLELQGTERPFSSQVDFTLYRVVQEGLTNVRKHACASQVKIELVYLLDKVRLTLSDNGIGTDETGGGFGLTGLQERLQLLNGTLQVQTAPGKGFILQVEIPA